ncbi:MAG: hypothetical protein AB7G11_12150 [Phycisphaerales bacterium]
MSSVRRLGRHPARTCPHPEWIEPLEPRTLLSPAPLPSLSDLQNPDNPVIRLSTSMGDIDIEMFAGLLPDLVSEYLRGFDRGTTCDYTFFHRSTAGFLQGGLFTFPRDSNLGAVAACSPLLEPITTGGHIANTERTVATGVLLDAFPGPGPFIFNLRDNSGSLDPDVSVVFGRVLDDRSWGVVQTIASLPVADLSGDGSFAGFYAGSFTSTPVTRAYDPGDENNPPEQVTPDLLVQNLDLYVLKATGAPDFYQYRQFEPEGFRSASIREFVPIENPNDEPVWFELVARFEEQASPPFLRRDDFIVSGMIAARSRGGATIGLGEWFTYSAVQRADRPFALELRSTLPVVASLSHYDFDAAISLSFTPETANTWVFPEVWLGNADDRDFLVWYNPECEDAEVTVQITTADGSTLDPIRFSTGALRRGGLSLGSLSTARGFARVSSTVPIVVARSHYSTIARGSGHAEYGDAGPGSRVGAIPVAIEPFRFGVFSAALGVIGLSVLNDTDVEVTLTVSVFPSGSPTSVPAGFEPGYIIAPGAVLRARGEFTPGADAYTLVYNASGPVHVSYFGRRFEQIGGAVPVLAGTEQHFAEGFSDPSRTQGTNANLFESLHLFNPFGEPLGIPSQTADIRITFRYTDGFELSLERTVGGGVASWLNVGDLPEIRQQAEENRRFYYSIRVQSDVPIVAQLHHLDQGTNPANSAFGGAFVLPGFALGPTTRLEDLLPG